MFNYDFQNIVYQIYTEFKFQKDTAVVLIWYSNVFDVTLISHQSFCVNLQAYAYICIHADLYVW